MGMDLITSAALDILAARILIASGLSEEQLEDTGIELSVGIELYRAELHERNPKAICDPYDEFFTFAEHPGLDYSDVVGSESGDLTPEHICRRSHGPMWISPASSQAETWPGRPGRINKPASWHHSTK